ncbi:MAG: aspartate aminotransferase family protein [Cytophagales bacterium]|nr:aspartate aminotransferase family protein [Cytophagales bacterium]
MYWDHLSHDEIKDVIFKAINKNSNYKTEPVLGIPASYLDKEEFYDDAPFLQDAPFLTSLIANPNHIGCHTLSSSQSEHIFKGTQQIEVDLIRICAEEIFGGEPDTIDGYVATGGTEGNIQACWIYRNYFIKKYGANLREITLVYSEDSHYSLPKAANVLNITSIELKVNKINRKIEIVLLKNAIKKAVENGTKYFIVVLNMGTTMFGSVDDIESITTFFYSENLNYKVHVDAAFGGFIYPFTNPESKYTFKNPKITSIILDAHKLLQAPFGTGIFLIRKGFMQYVCTEEARYIQGKDYTLCGSRSGANAISVWMILRTHGSDGWKVKISKLMDRTTHLCNQLSESGVRFFRSPFLNIIAIKAEDISVKLAKKYHLVADTFEGIPQWWKIVMMGHVKQGVLDSFISDLKSWADT